MKLNINNYDNETQEIFTSKLDPKMNSRVVIISQNMNDILSVKIYSILRREFSIILAQSEKNSFNFPIISINDIIYLEAFLILNRIETIIITSEFILNVSDENEKQIFLKNFNEMLIYCDKNSIKIIWIYVNSIFVPNRNNFEYKGLYQKDTYYELNNKIIELVSDYKRNLIIKFSTYYGIHDYFPTMDFPEYVYQNIRNKQLISYDSEIIIEPILSDEIGIYVSKHIHEKGILEISNDKNATTLYMWALRIIHTRGFDDNCNELIQPKSNNSLVMSKKESIKVNDFNSLEKGYETELKQKKCVFNLVYKLAPSEYFFGERVAESRIKLGRKLAESFDRRIIDKIDCIVPVPKTGLYYAMGLAQQLEKPYIQALTKDTTEMRSFQVLDANVRKEIIKNKIIPIQELIKDKTIILVDEAIFTGTTLKVVCKMLREYGVKEIHLGIPTPECLNQCPYYVQPKRAMLLEYIRKSMLETYFNVESVNFLKRDYFKYLVNSFGNACMKCFSD